ncbi:MAG: rRNA maturation RNase YbeY, partial [Phycisphaerales bacterium]
MSRAHEEYMGVPGTTDVMTFDMSDPAEGEEPVVWCSRDELETGYSRPPFVLDTDLLVCLDEGERQAAARGYAVERELLLYIVHGVMHCLGYDDHDEEGFLAMHEMEDAVLAAIGIGATFGDRRSES